MFTSSHPPLLWFYIVPTQQTCKISFKIIHSMTILLPKWREHIAGTEFKGQVLPRNVATRWNSTFDMLAAFLQMKEPIVKFLDCSSNGLSKYVLDNDKWEAVEGLVSVLKILKDTTMFFSTTAPSVAAVNPAMDAINQSFASGIIETHSVAALFCHALLIGKWTLNKYYALMDDSYIYWMAIGLYRTCFFYATFTHIL
ncbi:hypothetical protein EV360DRAFT_53128 [Lentinula raphanica]|nr:hypothetical protein EV360DRAFT_53128 [Lentinula raphanica]